MSCFNTPHKENSKLTIAIQGLSFTGKTYTALAIATGLVGENGRIAVIDCEGGEAELYASDFAFDMVVMQSPYTPEKYIEYIEAAAAEGYDVVIIDNISNEWAGDGGLLDDHATLEKQSKSKMSAYSAWNDITPRHNKFLTSMRRVGIHVIATIKSKNQYVIDIVDGVNIPRKIGLGPVQRELIDYEFSIYLEMDESHLATVKKDRTRIIGDCGTVFAPNVDTGVQLRNWLNGDLANVKVLQTPEPVTKMNTYSEAQVKSIRETYKSNGWPDSVFAAADLGNGKYDADRITRDFQQRKEITKNTKKQQLKEVPKQAAETKPAAKPSKSPEIGEKYTCEVCGAEISKAQKDTSGLFTGRCLCQKCMEHGA